jgi:hypothetical protein
VVDLVCPVYLAGEAANSRNLDRPKRPVEVSWGKLI